MHSAHYRADQKTRELEKLEIDDMLAQNVIKPAQIKIVAPIVFASMENDTLRFCVVDCRRLNALTKRDS